MLIIVMQKLVLQKQESLATLSLQCHNLQEVDLSDCESLTNSVCEVFSDGGGCPMLRSLVLDNCEACNMLVEEELEAAISHCSMLEILNIHSCPKVQLLAIL
ncbi:hypothetical protein B296_00008161 [Ensete ventricosum]|uniref:Uncharacterized protein n=1 Tax=Ensete ventricosum TaxID=4639 RepID=A0A426ZMB9_ENSVE|nr:hypothetical protein B296_00008161 [Ensete ventricosum]